MALVVQKVVCLSPLDTEEGGRVCVCQWMVSDLTDEACFPL